MRKQIQRLLAAAGYYNGAIDGIFGEKTEMAVAKILNRHVELFSSDLLHAISVSTASLTRKAIAAAQLILNFANYPVGPIDGYWGNQTEGAFLEWEHFQTYKTELVLDRTPIKDTANTVFPSQSQCRSFYGNPGSSELERQLVYVPVPYEMRIDFDLDQTTSRVRVHEKCSDTAEQAFNLVYKTYGYDRIRELGLDRFAGSYVPRRMRGGTSWSMHAYGCALDFFARPNGLTTRCPEALFCGDEYQDFFDIWESLGWVSLGRAIGRDWMHVQAATL